MPHLYTFWAYLLAASHGMKLCFDVFWTYYIEYHLHSHASALFQVKRAQRWRTAKKSTSTTLGGELRQTGHAMAKARSRRHRGGPRGGSEQQEHGPMAMPPHFSSCPIWACQPARSGALIRAPRAGRHRSRPVGHSSVQRPYGSHQPGPPALDPGGVPPGRALLSTSRPPDSLQTGLPTLRLGRCGARSGAQTARAASNRAPSPFSSGGSAPGRALLSTNQPKIGLQTGPLSLEVKPGRALP